MQSPPSHTPKSLFSNYHVNQKLQRDLCTMLQHTIETSIQDLQKIPVNNLRQQTLKPATKRFITDKKQSIFTPAKRNKSLAT